MKEKLKYTFRIVIVVTLSYTITMFANGCVEHYGAKYNDNLISKVSYYDEIKFPLSVFNRYFFVNTLMWLNKDKALVFIQESHVNPECKFVIKEFEIGKIRYWTILDETNRCRK